MGTYKLMTSLYFFVNAYMWKILDECKVLSQTSPSFTVVSRSGEEIALTIS